MKLGKLLEISGLGAQGKCEMPDGITPDTDITGIVTSSEQVSAGSVFVCIKGLHADGHEFINDAVRSGAVLIVAELGRDVSVGGAAALKVENTRRAAALLYNAWYGFPADKMKIIAVTGTNGKTSVTYMLRAIFEKASYRCGLIGTVGCLSCGGRRIGTFSHDVLANMTTPDPDELFRLLRIMADDGVQYVFIEATSHASALSKLDALHFDVAVFTNLTQDHLDFHGTMENYFLSKAKYFGMCDRAVINCDDRYGARLADELRSNEKCDLLTVSAKSSGADYCACDITSLGADGSSYTVFRKNGESIRLSVRIPGEFSVMNSLEAAAVAIECGIPAECIKEALSEFPGVTGRMERVPLPGNPDRAVFIDYAHTPDALENLLRCVRGFAAENQRIILVFGCGGDRDRTKRREMAHIASRFADFTVITSDNSRNEDPERIISDILKGIDKEKSYTVITDRKEAIEFAVMYSRPKDIILLAGKGHEKYEINRTGRHPFDEKEIVLEASRRLCEKSRGDIQD